MFAREPECISFLFLRVLGSSDIQEDHSQEQCQEEEAVRGIHRDATAAHIIRGLLLLFFLPGVIQMWFAFAMEARSSEYPSCLQLSERMKVVDVISSKTFSDSQQIIAQVMNLLV